MLPPHPTSTLFPYTTLFRSLWPLNKHIRPLNVETGISILTSRHKEIYASLPLLEPSEQFISPLEIHCRRYTSKREILPFPRAPKPRRRKLPLRAFWSHPVPRLYSSASLPLFPPSMTPAARSSTSTGLSILRSPSSTWKTEKSRLAPNSPDTTYSQPRPPISLPPPPSLSSPTPSFPPARCARRSSPCRATKLC